MNWHAMMLMASILAGSTLIAGFCVWLMERFYVHPAWILAGIFALAIIVAGFK